MEFDAIFRIIVGGIIGLIIASFSGMSEDVTRNKVKIDNLELSMKKTEKMVYDIHKYLLRTKK